MSTFVVIVSYNNIDLTRKCIQAVQRQDAQISLVVWDNASTDGTREMLENMDVNSYLSDENVYWTPAINGAVDMFWSGEKNICWLNNDAAPWKTCIGRLAAELEHPQVGLVAPMTSMIGGPQDNANNPDVMAVLSDSRIHDKEAAVAHLPSKRATFVLGACSMIRADVFHEVGGLDPDMVLGADDHDLCHKVREHGYEIRVVQSALCDHAGHASARTADGQKHWDELGGKCWGVHDRKWAGLFATEEEAGKVHWWGQFDPAFQFATGWDDEQRAAVGLPSAEERDRRYAVRCNRSGSAEASL